MMHIDPRRSVTRCFWLLLATITVIVPTFVARHGQGPALFIELVPLADGRAIFLIATVLGGGGTPIDIICGQNCRPMRCNVSSCTALLTGFPPGTSLVEGTVSVTISLSPTQTLESDPLSFRRFLVPTSDASLIVSPDSSLEMMIREHSLPADAYVVVMSTGTAPGPVASGHQLVGQPYSVRASGATVTSTKPMRLKLFYTDITLGEVDPHTLSALQWNPLTRDWEDLGGYLDSWIEHSVTTTTDRFTVYTLVATTQWRDGFNDLSGLAERRHTDILLSSGELILDGSVLTGTATSRVIIPTTSTYEWEQVTYARTVPTGTSLTIDVLSADGIPLLGDVTSGASLDSVDPTAHPSLKLRATLSTDNLLTSPSLDEWAITWQPGSGSVYLPMVLKQQTKAALCDLLSRIPRGDE